MLRQRPFVLDRADIAQRRMPTIVIVPPIDIAARVLVSSRRDGHDCRWTSPHLSVVKTLDHRVVPTVAHPAHSAPIAPCAARTALVARTAIDTPAARVVQQPRRGLA